MAGKEDPFFVMTNLDGFLVKQNKHLLFTYLPEYARFLLQNVVSQLAEEQLQLLRELDIPILKYVSGIPENELLERGRMRMASFLQTLADNRAEEHINTSLKSWMDDQLPLISRDKIQPEDITLINFVRRKMFRSFLPLYSKDPQLCIKIQEEMDIFTTEMDTRALKLLVAIQQDLYRQTQQLAQVGNWVWDLVKDKITWSDEVFNIYELTPQNEITYNLAAYNHPDDAQMISDEMARSRKTLQPHDFYYRIVLPDRREKTLHAKGRVLTDEKGEAYRMFGTLQDVTQQKLMENEIDEQQTIIQKIANLTPSIIAAYNVHTGKYLFINRAIETMLGYRQKEVTDGGVPFFLSIMHPEDVAALTVKNDEALKKANSYIDTQKEEIFEFLYRLKHADGDYRWMQTYGAIFSRNSKGEVEEVINISIDITEQINIANQLKSSHEELEQKNKELESFTYIASHDLQEPLRKIKFFIDQIKSTPITQDSASYYNRINNEVTRMRLMINGLLQYSLASHEELQLSGVDLNTVVEEVKADLDELIQGKRAVIEVDKMPVVNGMQLQLHQLFVNIIGNSLKYSRIGETPHITITSEIVAARNILPGEGNAHKISVSDNGIGFDEKYAEHIFELFKRLHAKSVYPGSGVGLTICKKIVENHKGVIHATGKPNKGATFFIYLPAE
ncbi:MAG TPA: PAS domain-containing protein [Chitinophagaceae bacterium]|nr:PAS domain-containing protein [Chitinophagaceae bacterium]